MCSCPDVVELHRAFLWDCDECGEENLERVTRVEMASEQLAAMREATGMPDGVLTHAIPWVRCVFCGTGYQSEMDT